MARSSPHFVKVFLPELCSQYLKIPPAFRVHLGSESLGIVSLRGPSGNVWEVELVERSNGLQLDRGWKKFVTDHDIETGDFLVFRLDGCSCFSVLVFDATACEKEVAFVARPCCGNIGDVGVDEHACGKQMADVSRPCQQDIDIIMHVKEEMVEEDEAREPKDMFLSPNNVLASVRKRKIRSINGLAIEGPTTKEMYLKSKRPRKSPDDKTGKQISDVISPPNTNHIWMDEKLLDPKSLHKKPIVSITNKIANKIADQCSPIESLSQNQKVAVYSLKQSNESSECLRLLKSGEVRRRGQFVAKVQKLPSMASQRRPVTKKEADKALRNSRSFKSNNPIFRVVMCDSHVYTSFYMNVPPSFARQHLPKISQRITLWDENDQPWEVTYVYCNYRGCLSGGWGAFSLAHNLEKSDVCIFELIRKNNLKVHTFRAIDKTTPLINFKSES